MKTRAVIAHLAAGFLLSPLVALLVVAGPLTAHLVHKTREARATAPTVAAPLRPTPATELTRQERRTCVESYEKL